MKKQTNKKKYNKIKITKKNVNNLNKKGGGVAPSRESNGEPLPIPTNSQNEQNLQESNGEPLPIPTHSQNEQNLQELNNEMLQKALRLSLNVKQQVKPSNVRQQVKLSNVRQKEQTSNISLNSSSKNNKYSISNNELQKYKANNPDMKKFTNNEIESIIINSKSFEKNILDMGESYITTTKLYAFETGATGDCFYNALFNTLLNMNNNINNIFETFKKRLDRWLPHMIDITSEENFIKSIRAYIAHMIIDNKIFFHMSQSNHYGGQIPAEIDDRDLNIIKKEIFYNKLYNIKTNHMEESSKQKINISEDELNIISEDMYKTLLSFNFSFIFSSAPTYVDFQRIYYNEDIFNVAIAINTATIGQYANDFHISILNFCLSYGNEYKFNIKAFNKNMLENNDSQIVIEEIYNAFLANNIITIPLYKLDLEHFVAVKVTDDLNLDVAIGAADAADAS